MLKMTDELTIQYFSINKIYLYSDNPNAYTIDVEQKIAVNNVLYKHFALAFDDNYYAESVLKRDTGIHYYLHFYLKRSFYNETKYAIDVLKVQKGLNMETTNDLITYFSQFKKHKPVRIEKFEDDNVISFSIVLEKQEPKETKMKFEKLHTECNICYETDTIGYKTNAFCCSHNNFCCKCMKTMIMNNYEHCPLCKASVKKNIRNKIFVSSLPSLLEKN